MMQLEAEEPFEDAFSCSETNKLPTPDESPNVVHSRSRQTDSESDPFPVPVSEQSDIDLDDEDVTNGTIEKVAKLKFDPSSKDFVIEGNLGDASLETPTGTTLHQFSRQDSIRRPESLGTTGGTNFNFNFSDCKFAAAIFGAATGSSE